MGGVVIFIFLVIIVINVLIAFYMDEVAKLKGYENAVFWRCFWLGLPGWLYVVALPDLNLRKSQEQIVKLLESNTRVSNTEIIYENDELPPL